MIWQKGASKGFRQIRGIP